ADGALRRRDDRARRAGARGARRVVDADPGRRRATGALAACARADLAEHLRRLAGPADGTRALAAAAWLGAAGLRRARARGQREGLSAGARTTRGLVRLAPGRRESDGVRARRAGACRRSSGGAVRGLRA